MCGIAGILTIGWDEPIPDEWLNAMYERISHRGPDGRGYHRDEITPSDGGSSIRIALVHARLSIIDIEGGSQPMVTGGGDADDRIASVFNGCIYNHRELRDELTATSSCEFVTDHSDTEVLLHGHRRWGANELPSRLEGMFAYAIWDQAAAALTLARDRAGEKPLYYWCGTNGAAGTSMFVFASSVPAIVEVLQRCGVALQLGSEALVEALQEGYVVGDQSPWVDVYELKAGHVLHVESGTSATEPINTRLDRYWVPPLNRRSRADSDLNVDRVESLLAQSVAQRLEADVPLGCFLSGGVDSSLIAHFAQSAIEGQLQTFSVKMPDVRFDESQHAEAVADHLGTQHTTLAVDPHPSEDLVHLIDQLGMPFGDSSILPTYWVSKAAREHVKVVLTGDGGDELFLGYERYQAARWLQRWSPVLRLIPSWPLSRTHPKSVWSKLARLGSAARHGGYADLRRIFPTAMSEELGFAMHSQRNGERCPTLAHAVASDFATYLPDDLLRKVDTASMTMALEVRCPFLDTALMEAALTAHVDSLMPNGRLKGLLKDVARRHLPQSVIDRPKMGFAIPIGEWFRDDYGGMKTLLLDTLGASDPFGKLPIPFKKPALVRLVESHMAGRANHGQRLFALLTTALWAQ